MWMTDYIREIQRQFITVYGFYEDPEKLGLPKHVPDGEYPMEIEGKVDHVLVVDGEIECCRFDIGEGPDFLDRMIADREAKSPGSAKKVDEAYRRRCDRPNTKEKK